MDPFFDGTHSDSEVPSRRPRKCVHCHRDAEIECLLCLKAHVRPVPCFCSNQCYQKHWRFHKKTTRNASTMLNPSTSLKTLPSYQTPDNYSTASYQSQSADDLYYESDGMRYYSSDCHAFDDVHESWMLAGHQPYMFRHYLMTGASPDAFHHS